MTRLHVHKIAGFDVVRGDLIQGGIKRLAVQPILASVSESEIVCASHIYGHSGLALAYAALENGRRVKLFFAGTFERTYVTEELNTLPNVECVFIPEYKHQLEVDAFVKQYAKDEGAYYFPIGFNCKPFLEQLIALAKRTYVEPSEVWVAVGSGTTLQCLKSAWPKAMIHGVNLGFIEHPSVGFSVIEAAEEIAQQFPPYPSAPFYDAKIWRLIKGNASPGALIWNIA